ncbi:NAD-dependent epimerase/dehydratase family protein [Candidatus Nitrospira salsa]|nr:MAG: NAD-dependent epimerase [Nitrospirales bacterium]
MNILILGGAGFLGSYVADEFLKRGHAVTIFDKRSSDYLQSEQKMVIGDLLDRQAVHDVVNGQDIVYNFAGFADLNASINNPLPVLELNILGNANVLDACVTHSVSRFVYASTAYVFSSKGSFYGVSKRCSEKIIEEFSRQFGLDYTIIRYGSVYGPRSDSQNRIYKLIKQALLEGKITFQGDGEEEREYIHVQDAATLSVQILTEEYRNQHVMLTGVERFKYSQLLNMIREMMDDGINIEYLRKEYHGHYVYTPYSFIPEPGKKMICNPFIDFGQGLLQTIGEIHESLQAESVIPR